MAADNELEPAAMEDIREMEMSKLNTDIVSVFFLIDRSPSYDTSNGNWSNSRLYKLKTGKDKNSKNIISEEIHCEQLNLYQNSNTELDMASGYCLYNALEFINKQFPAEYLGFIMWGHGTGWRSNKDIEHKNNYKGFAYDDSTDSYMTITQFSNAIGRALNQQKLDFLGLDTCFGGEIEVMYELKDRVNYAVGAEGLILLSGWDYLDIFNKMETSKNKSPKDFAKICIEEFSKEYELSINASIVAVDVSKIKEYFICFDNLMKIIAQEINSSIIRDKIFNLILSEEQNYIAKFSYGKENSDLYIDIYQSFEAITKLFPKNQLIQQNFLKFKNISDDCIFKSWASDRDKSGLGVFFGTLTSGNIIGTVHSNLYFKSMEKERILFVNDSQGYVPGTIGKNSFLDKLFYSEF